MVPEILGGENLVVFSKELKLWDLGVKVLEDSRQLRSVIEGIQDWGAAGAGSATEGADTGDDSDTDTDSDGGGAGGTMPALKGGVAGVVEDCTLVLERRAPDGSGTGSSMCGRASGPI